MSQFIPWLSEFCHHKYNGFVHNNWDQVCTKKVSPRAGRIVDPTTVDPKKRTAPPPMIPYPLTGVRKVKEENSSPMSWAKKTYLQDSQICKFEMGKTCQYNWRLADPLLVSILGEIEICNHQYQHLDSLDSLHQKLPYLCNKSLSDRRLGTSWYWFLGTFLWCSWLGRSREGPPSWLWSTRRTCRSACLQDRMGRCIPALQWQYQTPWSPCKSNHNRGSSWTVASLQFQSGKPHHQQQDKRVQTARRSREGNRTPSCRQSEIRWMNQNWTWNRCRDLPI